MLKEKLSLLPDNHRDALAADIDAIMYTTEGDVRIYYDDDGMFGIPKRFGNGQSCIHLRNVVLSTVFSFLVLLFIVHPCIIP